ncbi:MAG: hypothetical protein GY816_06635 [Cytophagales bacterium]|nr:hypothetical protein [Cytophagales bacterium]
MEAASADFLKSDNVYSLAEVERQFQEEECSTLGFSIIRIDSALLLENSMIGKFDSSMSLPNFFNSGRNQATED